MSRPVRGHRHTVPRPEHRAHVDAHLYLVDCLQQLGDLLAAMDGAAVERAVVFGLPVQKKWCR